LDITIFSVGIFMDHAYKQIAALHRGGTVRFISKPRQHAGPYGFTDWIDGSSTAAKSIGSGSPSAYLIGQCLVIWNGLLPWCTEIVAAARRKGMRTAFFEYGWFSGALQLDASGVNAESSLMHFPADWFTDYPVKAPGVIWSAEFKQRPIEFGSSNALPADAKRPTGYAFLPMQLDEDTQIRCHSPHYPCMRDFLRDVVASLPSGMPLVTKEHPSVRDQGVYRALREEFPSVFWCRTTPIDALLADASVVITINSSVGIQAMCRRTPLVTVGNAVYAKELLCEQATPKTLPAAIERALSTAPNHDLRERFLLFVKDRFLVPYVFSTMHDRVVSIANGKQPWLSRDWLDKGVNAE
jgi:capsular polysaccharide export protein